MSVGKNLKKRITFNLTTQVTTANIFSDPFSAPIFYEIGTILLSLISCFTFLFFFFFYFLAIKNIRHIL